MFLEQSTAAKERILAQKKLLQPWVGLAPTNFTFEQLKHKMKLSVRFHEFFSIIPNVSKHNDVIDFQFFIYIKIVLSY